LTEALKKQAFSDLRRIPGVGVKMAEALWELGIKSVCDLQGRDPEELYLKMCARAGGHVDRCVLYVFRCAVYFASNTEQDPELLKWWNWKDRKYPAGGEQKQ